MMKKNTTSKIEKNTTFSDRISLQIWEEMVGDFKGMTSDDGFLEIEIGVDNKKYKIELLNETENIKNIRKKLSQVKKGRKIGIIRTEKDYRVRLI